MDSRKQQLAPQQPLSMLRQHSELFGGRASISASGVRRPRTAQSPASRARRGTTGEPRPPPLQLQRQGSSVRALTRSERELAALGRAVFVHTFSGRSQPRRLQSPMAQAELRERKARYDALASHAPPPLPPVRRPALLQAQEPAPAAHSEAADWYHSLASAPGAAGLPTATALARKKSGPSPRVFGGQLPDGAVSAALDSLGNAVSWLPFAKEGATTIAALLMLDSEKPPSEGVIHKFVAATFSQSLSGMVRENTYQVSKYQTRKVTYDKKKEKLAPCALLNYETSANGDQSAHYVAPWSGERKEKLVLPSRVWLLFPGSDGTGLDWADIVMKYRNLAENSATTGFLLIDYPSFGHNGGKPNANTILESTECAVDALAEHLQVTRAQLAARCAFSVLGYSLGCATGLKWANHVTLGPQLPRTEIKEFEKAAKRALNVNAVVIAAPFNTLKKMARKVMGKLGALHLDWLIPHTHNWDNRVALSQYMAKRRLLPSPTHVTILHGEWDTQLPLQMGCELASMARSFLDRKYEQSEELKQAVAVHSYPEYKFECADRGVSMSFEPVPETNHKQIFQDRHMVIVDAMRAAERKTPMRAPAPARPPAAAPAILSPSHSFQAPPLRKPS